MPKRLLFFKLSLLLGPFLFVTAVAQRTSPAPGQTTSPASAPLVVSGLGEATAPLGGTWQFHLGDDPSWASPSLDDSHWESLQVNKPWGEQTHFGYTGYAWYRRHVDFTPVPGAAPNLALFVPPIDDVYEIYWNGQPVGQLGEFPPHAVWYYQQPAHTFRLGTTRSGVLAIRVWKAPYLSFDNGLAGGLNAPLLAGNPAAIGSLKTAGDYRWLRNRQYFFALQLFYGLVFALSLMAWVRDRSQKLLFWMSMYALGPLLALFLVGLRLPISYNVGLGLLQPVLSLTDIALWFLLLYLLKLDEKPGFVRFTRFLAWISFIATLLDGGMSFIDWAGPHVHFWQITDALLTLIFTITEMYPLFLVPFAFRKRLALSRWLVAIFAFLSSMVFSLRIAFQQGSRYTHWTFANKITAPLFSINGNQFPITRITDTLLLVAIVYAVYRYSVDESERKAAVDQEFRSAQELQRILVPETLPALEGYAITSAYRPAQQVGGDFFQLITHPDGSAVFLLGDVSGKGLKAAMAVSMLIGAARTLAETSAEPTEIIAGLNRRLYRRLGGGFVTCQVLRIESNGDCVLANAGHLPPFLNGDELEVQGSLPLGLAPSVIFPATSFHLGVHDRLTFYTDGLLEARNAHREIYGFDRVRELMGTHPDAKTASEEAVRFGQEDDITVLTITRLATGVESTTSLLAPDLIPTLA